MGLHNLTTRFYCSTESAFIKFMMMTRTRRKIYDLELIPLSWSEGILRITTPTRYYVIKLPFVTYKVSFLLNLDIKLISTRVPREIFSLKQTAQTLNYSSATFGPGFTKEILHFSVAKGKKGYNLRGKKEWLQWIMWNYSPIKRLNFCSAWFWIGNWNFIGGKNYIKTFMKRFTTSILFKGISRYLDNECMEFYLIQRICKDIKFGSLLV